MQRARRFAEEPMLRRRVVEEPPAEPRPRDARWAEAEIEDLARYVAFCGDYVVANLVGELIVKLSRVVATARA